MAEKWAPGPWRIPSDNPTVVLDKDDFALADCFYNDGDQTGEANARLIAAAPDLFDALSRAYDLCVGLRIEFPNNQAIREIGDQARAVLAKARDGDV